MKQPNQGKKYSKRAVFWVLSLLVGIVVISCSESGKAPSPTATPITAKPSEKPVSQPTPTLIEQQPPQIEYSYNPAGRRDPFAPIIEREEKQAKTSARPPLERYNISDFKLTGIIWGGFGYNAMVEGPDGKGYFVRVGTIMGLNRGVVKKITQNKMVIEEKFKNFSGETESKEIVVELQKKQEGMQ